MSGRFAAVCAFWLGACGGASAPGPAAPSEPGFPSEEEPSPAAFLRDVDSRVEGSVEDATATPVETGTVLVIREPVPGADVEVAAQFGCDVLTGTQVRAEAFRIAPDDAIEPDFLGVDRFDLAADPERWRAAFLVDPQPWADEAREWLVRRLIIRRQAEQLGIVVTTDDVDETIAGMMAMYGWSADDLAQNLDRWERSMDEYRAEIADVILENRVLRRLKGLELRVTDEDVRAEFDRIATEADGADVRPFEEVCGGLRRVLVSQRWSDVTEAYFAAMRRLLESLPTHVENGMCVEDWPEAP
jgi:hypothetical protein